MKKHLGIVIVTVCAAWWGSGAGAPAFAEELDAGKMLFDSAELLNQQQEVEAKLAAIRAQQQELEAERSRLQGQAGQYNEQRQANETTCGSGSYYTMHMAQCEQERSNLSTGGADLGQKQTNVSKQLQNVTTEGEQLKAKKEQLDRQAEAMTLKLKRLELSGVAQECASRLPKDNLESMVATYQQCWDGTSSAEPHFKPKSPTGPSVGGIGPLEQMGIEDEKRRKRRAKQLEAQ